MEGYKSKGTRKLIKRTLLSSNIIRILIQKDQLFFHIKSFHQEFCTQFEAKGRGFFYWNNTKCKLLLEMN